MHGNGWLGMVAIDIAGVAGGCLVRSRVEKSLLSRLMPILKTLKNKIKAAVKLGPAGAWYYFAVMPRILKTSPVVGLTDARCEVHALTSRRHWLYLMWALKSFYAKTGRKYALCIHDDGTLPPKAFAAFRAHFPDARVIPRSEADVLMAGELAGYPMVRAFREQNRFAQKMTDYVAYLRSGRMLMLDSDILVFSEPVELLRRIEDPAYVKNTFNADGWCTLTVTKEAVRAAHGVELVEKINAGLGLVQAAAVNYALMEKCLKTPTMPEVGHYVIEQDLQALISSIHGVELLPDEYTVDCSNRPTGNRPLRHYTSPIRHRMFSEGMRRLAAEGFLAK